MKGESMLLRGFGIEQRKRILKYFRKMIFALEKKHLNRKVGICWRERKTVGLCFNKSLMLLSCNNLHIYSSVYPCQAQKKQINGKANL